MFKDDDDDPEATMGAVKYPVMPSLVALQQMRNRLHLAYLGKKLMKWTVLATGKEMRRIALEMAVTFQSYASDVRRAYILLARARYFTPTLNTVVMENVDKHACITTGVKTRSTAGVKITVFKIRETVREPYEFLGIGTGGTAIKEAKDAWLKLLRLMITILQQRTSFAQVETANRNANKRQNVLSKIVIPRTIVTVRYILGELEEKEREEFFRIKKIIQVKAKVCRAKEKNSTRKPLPPLETPRPPPPVTIPIPLPPPPRPVIPQPLWVPERVIVPQPFWVPEPVIVPKPVRVPEPVIVFEPVIISERVIVPQRVRVPEPVFISEPIRVLDRVRVVETEPVRAPVPMVDKCVLCDIEIPSIISAADEAKLERLWTQINDIVDVARELENKGISAMTVENFLMTAEELKRKLRIKSDHFEPLLCDTCKEKLEAESQPPPPAVCKICQQREAELKVQPPPAEKRTPSPTPSFPPPPTPIPSISRPSTPTPSIPPQPTPTPSTPAPPYPTASTAADMNLGTFSVDVKEITKIFRVQHPDGTVTEEKSIIKIRRETGGPSKSKPPPPPPPPPPNANHYSGRVMYQPSDSSIRAGASTRSGGSIRSGASGGSGLSTNSYWSYGSGRTIKSSRTLSKSGTYSNDRRGMMISAHTSKSPFKVQSCGICQTTSQILPGSSPIAEPIVRSCMSSASTLTVEEVSDDTSVKEYVDNGSEVVAVITYNPIFSCDINNYNVPRVLNISVHITNSEMELITNIHDNKEINNSKSATDMRVKLRNSEGREVRRSLSHNDVHGDYHLQQV